MDKRDKSKKRFQKERIIDNVNDDKPSHEDDRPKFDRDEYEKRRRCHKKLIENEMRKYWEKERDRYHYTPWLLIRYAPGDFGLRPIPSGDAHWHSPDIWIESSDSSGNGVAGEENFLHARIFNLGMANAIPVKVDFHWANPALGLGAANMNHIGSEWVEVRSQSLKEVRCNTPWIPVHVNNGHECLKVNCTNAILDPITAPFDPRVDRHVGQRNVTVLPAQAGETLPFQMELNNFLPMKTKTTVFLRAAHIAVRQEMYKKLSPRELTNTVLFFNNPLPDSSRMKSIFRRGTSEYRNAQVAAKLSNLDGIQLFNDKLNRGFKLRNMSPSIIGQVSESRRQYFSNQSALTYANHIISKDIFVFNPCARRTDMYKFQELNMQSLESRKLDVELGIPAGACPGDQIAFHFEQWADDVALGGYTVIARIQGGKAEHSKC